MSEPNVQLICQPPAGVGGIVGIDTLESVRPR
jgi:hypothetical protein